MRLITGVDDRSGPSRRGGHTLPDVFGALTDAVDGTASRRHHLASPADQLTGHQKRDEDVREPAELTVPSDEVVLMTAIGVARGVGVVLEQEDVPRDALVVKPLLRVEHQPFEDPLARL